MVVEIISITTKGREFKVASPNVSDLDASRRTISMFSKLTRTKKGLVGEGTNKFLIPYKL